jgi:hypothetical protein
VPQPAPSGGVRVAGDHSNNARFCLFLSHRFQNRLAVSVEEVQVKNKAIEFLIELLNGAGNRAAYEHMPRISREQPLQRRAATLVVIND